MASCPGGYATDRFKVSVDNNFLCPICSEVLKDPVQCQNQHHFCKVCIKKHLETNAKSCPICVQDLEEKTLAEPPRILTDYLNGLLISCDHSEKGCTEVIPVSQLKAHVRECKYRPVVCPNEKCGQTFNQEDLVEHVNNACEYRLIHCPDCEDDMIYKKFSKHACVLSKDLNKLRLEWAEVKNVLYEICNSQKEMSGFQKEMANNQKEMSNYQKEMSSSQKVMSVTQKEMFNSQKEMSSSQTEMANSQKEVLHSVQGLSNGQHNIALLPQAAKPNVGASVMVIGGRNEEDSLSSVEVLYPGSEVWTMLQPMEELRASAASVLYGNDVIVSGGRCNEGCSDTLEMLSLVNKPLRWIPFPVKLPHKSCGHNGVVINNYLYLVGGFNMENLFNSIYRVLLHPPYTVEFTCEMHQAVCFHGLQAFEEFLLIIGGSRSKLLQNSVNTVLTYNTVNDKLNKINPLPFAICDVTSVRWNDKVIIIGGTTHDAVSLNTVIMYNVNGSYHRMLPSMKYARSSCAATVADNHIVVMGGYDWFQKKFLSSVECFDLDRQVWKELPPMNEARSEATAVVYAGLF